MANKLCYASLDSNRWSWTVANLLDGDGAGDVALLMGGSMLMRESFLRRVLVSNFNRKIYYYFSSEGINFANIFFIMIPAF